MDINKINKTTVYQNAHQALENTFPGDFAIENITFNSEEYFDWYYIDFSLITGYTGKISLRVNKSKSDFLWFIDIKGFRQLSGNHLHEIIMKTLWDKRDSLKGELSILEDYLNL